MPKDLLELYTYMASTPKTVYIDKIDNIINEYNNTYHRRIKKNPIDFNASTYFDFGVENNDNDPKFQVGNHVRISKYKSIFSKGYSPNL